MKIKEVIARVEAEQPKTSYAKGVKAYAEDMLRSVAGGEEAEVPRMFAPLQEMILGGEEGWESKSRNSNYVKTAEGIIERLGLTRVIDVAETDIHEVEGNAMKSAFMLIWGEVECQNRMEETYMIRRSGRG